MAALLLGEQVNIGVGIESFAARGTAVAPTFWIGGRSPTGVHSVIEQTMVRETRGARVPTQGAELVQLRAEGDLEFNLRSATVGPILLALLGDDTVSTLETGVYSHVFSILTTTPQIPTLTLGLSQAGAFQDYQYAMALVNSLEIRTPVNDLVNATAGFIAKSEATTSAYTPSFSSTDYAFRPQDVSFKFATTLAGLTGATAIKPKAFSLSIKNNARPNQNIGELNPSDVIALETEITGTITFDYTLETYHDLVKNGTFNAVRIAMSRADITIGTTNHPTLTIDLAKCSFNDYKPNRPIDDIVTEEITFTGHYSDSDAKAITATLINTTATYEVA